MRKQPVVIARKQKRIEIGFFLYETVVEIFL
jgi:hypothetical protein